MAPNTNKPKKVNFFVATLSELKQVSWLSMAETMKRLGAVLLVSLIFLVLLTGIDALLGFINNQLFSIVEGSKDILDGSQIAALIIGGVLVLLAIAGVVIYRVVKAKNNKKPRGEYRI